MSVAPEHSIQQAILGPDGFSTELSFAPDELSRIKDLISQQWLARIQSVAADQVAQFAEAGIERYHELSQLVDHSTIWPKRERILPAAAVDEIRQMSLIQNLAAEFGDFTISSEDGSGWEEVYWRLVRPNETGDVGPLHADRWFWDLGHGETPPNVDRVKVWVAVVTEPGLNGLRVVPGSHQREWNYRGEERHGMIKPQFDEDDYDLDPQLIDTAPGTAIVFHDGLLHGGALNRGTTTRVSFEFTMFVTR